MTETRNYYTTRNHVDHSTFGGTISNYDFCGYHSMSDIAKKIISDMSFDKQCKANALNRDRQENYKKEVE